MVTEANMMTVFKEIAVSAAAFITTNLDDICLLVLFFSVLKKREQFKYVVLGEYLGIATLDLISLFSALGLSLLFGKYVWVVGFLPVAFGIKALIELLKGGKEGNEDQFLMEGTWALVAKEWAVTVANGGDNVSVYIPLLNDMGNHFLIFFITMMAMTTIWWSLAKAIVSLPRVSENISRISGYVLPAVFITVGLLTIYRGVCG